MSNSLLAAALSAVTNRSVVTYDDYLKGEGYDEYSQLDQKALHQSHLVGGKVSTFNEQDDTTVDDNQIRVFIQGLSGRSTNLVVNLSDRICNLKARINEKLGISPEDQRLIFKGRQLEDSYPIAHYGIKNLSTIYTVIRVTGGGDPCPRTALFIHPDSLAPSYDYDFTQIDDKGTTFMRGNFEYKRPCGWKRIALNVLNKYEDNIWLGVNRNSSTSSAENEWPVSYHGTAKHNCKSISEEGYDLSKCVRHAYGHGIYSTPDINVAYKFAIGFIHEGDNYKIVFQNRVNPNSLTRISNETTKSGEYWISPKDKDVRPYGICIKKEN